MKKGGPGGRLREAIRRYPIGAVVAALAAFFMPLCAWAVKIEKGPYLQDVAVNAVTVCWETDEATGGDVAYAPAPGAGVELVEPAGEAEVHHCVRLKGLKPSTEYAYSVAAGDARSGSYRFRTAKVPGEDVRFVVYGDSRSNELVHKSIAGMIAGEKPDFVLNTGDVVGDGKEPSHWARFFRGVSRLAGSVPYYVSIGNHEKDHPNYFHYFSFPGNEHWYSFDYGGSHFVALDSNMPYRMDPEQKKWLRKDLEKSGGAAFTFVFFHHPMYSAGHHGSDLHMRRLYEKMFQEYGVDVVFMGHDHDYQRSEPPGGVVYVVTGGGGAGLRDVGAESWTKVSRKVHHYVAVEIRGGRLEGRAVDVNGKVFDTFSLDGTKKRQGF
ncbi:MAG: metallophosphoesterase [bacterium]